MTPGINVKEAVSAALAYARELFSRGVDFTLEETELSDDDQYWLITLGFIDEADSFAFIGKKRKYKQFKVNKQTGQVEAMKIRIVE